MFPKEGGTHMTSEEYKKHLKKMIDKINDNKILKRIYELVHYYFVKM